MKIKHSNSKRKKLSRRVTLADSIFKRLPKRSLSLLLVAIFAVFYPISAAAMAILPENLQPPPGRVPLTSMADNIQTGGWFGGIGGTASVAEGVLRVVGNPAYNWPTGVDLSHFSARPGDTIQIAVAAPPYGAAVGLQVAYNIGELWPGPEVWRTASNMVHLSPGQQHTFEITVTSSFLINERFRVWRDASAGRDFYITGILLSRPDNLPAPPTFSHGAGFYDAEFNLVLQSEPDTVIRFTTDGNIPTNNSPIFNNHIRIHAPVPTLANSPMSATAITETPSHNHIIPSIYYNGMVIRARAFNDYGVGSETVSRSFFVNSDRSDFSEVQVMSIIVEPQYFADPTLGFYRNWQRRNQYDDGVRSIVNMEMFAPGGGPVGGDLMFSQNVQAWIMGQSSRERAKKPMRFNFNQGDGDIRNMPNFIPDTFRNFYDPTTPVENFRHVNARASDSYFTGLRDTVAHLISEPLRPMIQNATYGAVFVNGEFWGMYCFRAHRNAYLVGEMFGLPRNDIAMNRDWQDRTHATGIYNLLRQHGYEGFQQYVCIDDLIDYIIIQYHFANGDGIRNNFEYWRLGTQHAPTANPIDTHGGDGRWRFIVQDLDIAMGRTEGNLNMRHDANWLTQMTVYGVVTPGQWFSPGPMKISFLNELFSNQHFRETFAARYSTYAATVFNPVLAGAILDDMVEAREPFAGAGKYRWTPWIDSPEMGLLVWQNNVNDVRDFLTLRTRYSIRHIAEHFEVPYETTNITWIINPSQGFFDIAGAHVRADLFERQGQHGFSVHNFTARYLRGLPITFTVVPELGYELDHFLINGVPHRPSADMTVTITPGVEPMTVTAVFAESEMRPIIMVGGSAAVAEASVGGIVQITADAPPAGQRFSHWSSTPDVIFANHTDPTTSFTMVDSPVTITANFSYIANLPPQVLINHVHGGGPESSNTLSHSFIELYNQTDEDIYLGDWSLQVQSPLDTGANGTPAVPVEWEVLALTGYTIPSRRSLLIVSTQGVWTGAEDLRRIVPQGDIEWNQVFSNRGFAVALVDGHAGLPMFGAAADARVIDMVGMRNDPSHPRDNIPNYFVAPTRNSRSEGARRINFQNTRNNSDDFVGVRYGVISDDEWQQVRPRNLADGEWSVDVPPTGLPDIARSLGAMFALMTISVVLWVFLVKDRNRREIYRK